MLPVVISVLTALAEEYAAVREALVVFHALKKVSDVHDVLTTLREDRKFDQRAEFHDEIYFYLLTLGLYHEMTRMENDPPDWSQICSYVDEVLISDMMRNAPEDAVNKIAAFTTMLGKTMSVNDPDRISDLARIIADERVNNTLIWYIIPVLDNSIAIRTLTEHLGQYDVMKEEIQVVTELYKTGHITKVLEGFRSDVAARGVDQSNSFVNLIYGMYLQDYSMQASLVVAPVRGAVRISTLYLPSSKPSPLMMSSYRKAFQDKSLTNEYINIISGKMMRTYGYAYDETKRSWERQDAVRAAEERPADDLPNPLDKTIDKIVSKGRDRLAKTIKDKFKDAFIRKMTGK